MFKRRRGVHEWVYVGAIVKSSVYLKFGPTTAFTLLFSIVVMAARTLGDDVFTVLRRDDVCMKEQSCPGHGLWGSVTTGQRGEWGGGESC